MEDEMEESKEEVGVLFEQNQRLKNHLCRFREQLVDAEKDKEGLEKEIARNEREKLDLVGNYQLALMKKEKMIHLLTKRSKELERRIMKGEGGGGAANAVGGRFDNEEEDEEGESFEMVAVQTNEKEMAERAKREQQKEKERARRKLAGDTLHSTRSSSSLVPAKKRNTKLVSSSSAATLAPPSGSTSLSPLTPNFARHSTEGSLMKKKEDEEDKDEETEAIVFPGLSEEADKQKEREKVTLQIHSGTKVCLGRQESKGEQSWNDFLKESTDEFAVLMQQPGIFIRTFIKHQTIVNQDASNSCIFRLLEGTIRFENRIVHKRAKRKSYSVSVFGRLDDTAEWPFFCELSALRIQSRTSAAAVSDSQTKIAVIPVKIFLHFAEKHPSLRANFYRSLCRNLAWMLRGLHSRTLSLLEGEKTDKEGKDKDNSHLSLTIQNQPVIMSWVGYSVGKLKKQEGRLLVSEDYVCFVKKKNIKKEEEGNIKKEEGEEGGEGDPILLKNIIEFSSKDKKLLIRAKDNKIYITFKPPVSPDAVKALLITASSSPSTTSTTSNAHPPNHSTNSFCINCGFDYCSLCQTLPPTSNPCPSPTKIHEFFPPAPTTHHHSDVEITEPNACKKCGNKGTHLLTPQDLSLMLRNFQRISVPEGGIIQEFLQPVEKVGYVLKGTLVIFLPKFEEPKEGEEEEGKARSVVGMVEVGEVGEGELVGEIGAILGKEASGRVVAGKGGCELLEISKGFLLEEEKGRRKGFQIRILFAMMKLMWNRILNQEKKQVDHWNRSRICSPPLTKGDKGKDKEKDKKKKK